MTFVSGHYFRIPSNRLSEGDRAHNILSDVHHGATTGQLLRMKIFYKSDSVMGGFTVSLTRMRRAPIEVFSLDTETKTYSWVWEEIQICIPPGNLSVLLTATQGDFASSDLAVDEFMMTDVPCNDYTKFEGN